MRETENIDNKKKIVIILPTYNELENIERFLNKVLEEIQQIHNYDIQILVIDDYSPDGTAEIVKKFKEVVLLQKKKEGLGAAYIKGFQYAINELSADYIIEMDSDFSHNPKDISRLIEQIDYGFDFVIGSRYIKGGAIPDNWGWYRKANSKYGNIFARFIAGLYKVHDCTSGFRLINSKFIKQIDFRTFEVSGYSFQMNILFELIMLGANVKEIPIIFVDRKFGKSKLNYKDVFEFMKNSFVLGYRAIRYNKKKVLK